MSTLVRSTVGILHRELATTVTDTEQCALELGVALLSLPDIHLTYPPDLTVPCAERVDAVGLCTLGVAGFFLVADACPEAGKIEVQAVVVFRPSRALEGDELCIGGGLYL